MIVTMLSGRKGSKGVPNKNVFPMLGRPLFWYPLQAAKHSKHIERIFISTDSDEISDAGRIEGATVIQRPPELATDEALLEDVLLHGFQQVSDHLGEPPEMFVILLCNAATIRAETIDRAIEMLRENPDADSVATVALMNQYGPVRAKKIVNGLMEPAVDMSQFKDLSCDRKCLGDIFFCDASLWVLRPQCMDYSQGQPPFRWMGKNILPLVQQGGLDVDDELGLILTEYWLRKNGFSETSTPYGASK
ncbi:cytidylyltransferase domain-containing protein [Geobacter sp. DSM 9736]|uniref:acylneuraminate cytidylyltransferase family protein n=1 Tax=Geobacter sp. DSM 9736 TaxID=1277350 RepID=UPI000B5006E2|nr:NTP transferase domain-containing protein [Geobacter sp. DSM 9736]SNB47002.1 N-acylneuraminate cytidylyltransferase [Geobacter sp. DSM 9736]